MDTKTKAEFQEKVEEIRKTKKGKGIEIAINKLRKQFSPKNVSGFEYLEGKEAECYFHDMNIAQIYAQLNRRVIAREILSHIYKKDFMKMSYIESIHNYISFSDGIIRKGAISAHKGEKVIIPLNMADGSILGIGKGNEEWNNSAPHGAGRKMSRNKARANIQLSDFQKIMRGRKIWSTCISKYTLDESPQAYKKARDIIRFLAPTVEIISHMKPLYNFKAPE
jgi:RNA-splicing ligase RtcB